uniref:BRCA1-A complex subunit RAP80 n=1 Tax=Semicossyphus pulcher TaxID=241346 RepID=UPI0037E840C5
MRGRRGHSSSSVCQQQSRMALRKHIMKDCSEVPSESQQSNENTQEEGDLDDRDDNDELSSSLLSSSRGKRRRERESKTKPKEMTEEEMMDLALRLSKQEASITALRQQKEEEAVMKAIQESMVSQTQPCPPYESQSLLADAEASLRLCSRRKLSYSNRKLASEDGCSQETDLNGGAKESGDESQHRSKKRKRREGSPLLEMPDLSQTQKNASQASICSSEPLDLQLDSPQSSDSIQIEDCKSPVFPSTGCRAEVQVLRLSHDLLDSCRTSGFVLCSQDSSSVPQNSLPAQPKSPTFPKSSRDLMLPRSPMFSETDPEDDTETQLIPDVFKSPVFGRSTQLEKSQSACRPQVCNSGFTFSSQDSLTTSVRSTSCRPHSPVFPRSPGISAVCKSPETDRGHTEQSHGCSTSPVFDRIDQRPNIHLDVQKRSASAAAGELRGSSQSLKQDNKTDHNPDVRLNNSEEELRETSKDCNSAEMELSNDMKLLWSDDDEDDVTPVGSPSPVFPEERPVSQADRQAASLNDVAELSQGRTGSNCRPSSSSTSMGRQQLTNSQHDRQLGNTRGTVSRSSAPSGEPAGGTTVHYYWGVPFCPRGLNPDSYTQVILAQMDVYEKSLKQAQRCLLRKAEWGGPVLPQLEKSPLPESQSPESPQQDVPRRRGLGLRGKRLSEDDDTPPPPQGEEEDKTEGEEEQERETKEEEKKKKEGGKEQVDSDGCEVCPETQLSNDDDDRTQDLMMDTNAGTELPPKSPEEPDVQLILRDDSPARDDRQEEEQEEEMEVDAPVNRKPKGSIPVSGSDFGGRSVRKEELEEDREDPDVEMRGRVLQRSTSPELELATRSPQTKVDCPICQGSFPATEIEMHAAYCDGEVAVVHERRPKADCFQVSLKPRRKRTRRADVTEEEEITEPSNTGNNQEKCYICQKAFPLRDYSRHIELCIQRQASKPAAKGTLLSALEQTDTRDSEAGPSGSDLQPGEVIDLRDDDDEEEQDSVSALRISNSPIRAFTPISEATDCLIDFKKQKRVKKLSQRRR